jgi:phage terminase large subunit-like protein
LALSSLARKNNELLLRVREEKKRINFSLTPEELVIRQNCENSFATFIKEFWCVVEGENEFFDNWHIDVIAKNLEDALNGKIQYLVINIPFRCMKSLICNVFYPAWLWVKKPHSKIFCLTGDKELAHRDSVKCRRLLQSEKFQRFWSNKFRFNTDVNTNSRYSNDKGGERMIKSIGGNSIGHGGHFIIIDDINRQDDIIYKTKRDLVNNKLESAVLNRKDNTTSGVIIMIMQRLHEEDAANLLLSKNLPGTVHLMLPMMYDPDRACPDDPRRIKGELLWPSRFPLSYVKQLITTLRTELNISSQLQQCPTAGSGHVFRREWFKIWKEESIPTCTAILQSWDTALSTSIDACESACTTWGIFQTLDGSYNIILLNCWTGKLEQPNLRKMIVNAARNYHAKDHYDTRGGRPVDLVIIEEAYNGKALIQDLKTSGIPIFGFSPRWHGLQGHASETSKLARASLASITAEQGLIWLPERNGELLPFAKKVLDSLLACPTGKHQDICDSFSQAMIEIRNRELVYITNEQPEHSKDDWPNDPRLPEYMGHMFSYAQQV